MFQFAYLWNDMERRALLFRESIFDDFLAEKQKRNQQILKLEQHL